jgi:hypothetical protein
MRVQRASLLQSEPVVLKFDSTQVAIDKANFDEIA